MESRPYHYSYHLLLYMEWWIDATLTPPMKVRGGLTCNFVCCFPECSLDEQDQRHLVGGVADFKTEQEPLLVVSRRSTRCEKIQIAGLLSGTMRRISRARSIVSGVELWHPAKPLLENRVFFVHCIVIIMHCLSETISKRLVLFSK